MTNQTNDPWDSARDAKPRPAVYWGQLLADAQFVVLEKGIGRLPFDPQTHPPERKVTAVDMSLMPIAEMGMDRPIERNAIAEFAQWTKIIQPSILALGVEPRELNEKYVKVQMVPDGRTYKNTSGEDVNSTTFKFIKLFADENECIADYLSGNEDGEEGDPSQPTEEPVVLAAQSQPTNGGGAAVDAEKTTAMQFLKVLVKNAANGQTDLTVVQNTLQASLDTTPLVSKHFKVDSPETIQLIAEAMGG